MQIIIIPVWVCALQHVWRLVGGALSQGLAVLLAVLAAVLLFRIAPGQGAWKQPAARPRLVIAGAAVALVLSAIILADLFGPMVSLTLLLCLMMLVLSALPYLALLSGKQP